MKSYANTRAWEYYPVSKKDNMVIFIHNNNIVTYYYESGDMSFEFGLLSEVGEKWRLIFKRYIEDNNIKIETVDEPDYYGERIVYV